ncbi:rho guanine nucleotide exchange factor 17 [Bombina bombina]|uniref:rho guanine nucleotide exchange factor 17 n=1 Tax=Bombina bombina TaxID=8345 RepID=UPI00235AE32D|nr:rho guanine nucleotide exchange factor 17 [Bombina bombina]
MAERDGERKVRVYRSVSFKKLENWNAKSFGGEGGTQLPREGDVTQPTCQKAHRSPARSLSLSRKVSKISAASKAQRIPSTSVNEISQRFSSRCRDEEAQSDDESSRRLDYLKGGCRGEYLKTTTLDFPAQKDQPRNVAVPPAGCDGLSLALPGKSADLCVSVKQRGASRSGTLLDEVTLNSYCSLLNHPDNREVIGVEGGNWPSVTEMRKLFGESNRKQPNRASSLPDYDESKVSAQTMREPSVTAITEPHRHCPVESTFAKNFNLYAKDNTSAACYRTHPSSRVESTYCRGIPAADSTACIDTEEQKFNTGPKPQPPPPPPRSCIPFGLRAHTLVSSLPKQESRQQPDSLHSLHSSGKPQTAPSNVRLKDSSKEELYSRDFQLPSTANKNGSKVTSPEMSSGSEEENDLVALRESVRKRSLRKKKKDIVSFNNKESDDSDRHSKVDTTIENKMAFESKYSDIMPQKCNLGLISGSPTMGLKSGVSLTHNTEMFLAESKETPMGFPNNIQLEENKQQIRAWPEGTPPACAGHLTTVSPIPVVSRVAKVNIPPIIPSPCGSRNSSRYSSTETLKEDDHCGSYFAGHSRNIQGGFNIYRSPSVGQSDNIARQYGRTKAKVPIHFVKVKNTPEVAHFSDLESENAKQKKSMSNPDIASETLSLLNFIKSDLPELKMRTRGNSVSEKEIANATHESYQGSVGRQNVPGKSRPLLQNQNRLQQGNRPTLKDLTATLRRTKSFTYSDKPGSRRIINQGCMKQSSSELMLSSTGDNDVMISDHKVDNCVELKEEIFSSDVTQDQYIQEARQVFEKISQIGSQEHYSFDQDDTEHLKAEKAYTGFQKDDSVPLLQNNNCLLLRKSESEENMSCRKSLEELSGHESSMTDEGIVTELDTVPSPSSYRDLGQTLTVWKSPGIAQEEKDLPHANNREAPLIPSRVMVGLESDTSDATANRGYSQGPLDAPPTPGSTRRRRKFPSVSSNSTDSSFGSNGESGSETYRSLSDPMPHRTYSVTEEPKKVSVDSNLLGSLNSKSGIPESSAMVSSDCTGSAASVLSFCSDGVKDYNTVIQNIVSQPGALDKVIDEKGNGKTIKKKSFSDPSRRGELSPTGFDEPGEAIKENEQPILSSSSEPILSEQRDELGELEELDEEVVNLHSQSENIFTLETDENGIENQNFSFDPKLSEVLSPRTVRRSFKKRTNRTGYQESKKECEYPTDALGKGKVANKHVRHTSEPASFIPITSPEPTVSGHPGIQIAIPESAKLPVKPCPILQGPLLEDVSKHYMANLSTGDPNVFGTVDMPRTAPSTPTTAEPKLFKAPKPLEEVSASIRSKPFVDMRKHVFMTLLDTEQSYVESLRTLMEGYMKPLKLPENSFLCDPSLVDEIFDQIPELLEHHEQFLEQVHHCIQNWQEIQTVGDILGESFSKEILVNIYSAYIDNFLNAKDAVRVAKEARPAFLKFLEQCTRENKEKQALSDLMIKPVQRIPRYELIVKDLLKHTAEDHPDYPCLLDAQRNIKQLAERINKGVRSAEEAERDTRILQEIESHIEGMEDLQVPFRRFVRQEMVVEVKAVGGKKDRSLFLFTDLLICTTLKRKSGSLRRSSMSLYTAASVIDIASKYKLLWKFPLEDVDIVKGTSQTSNRDSIQKTISRLDEDLSTMGQISKLSETLSFPHQSLDDVIKDMMATVHRELAEKQSLAFTMSFPPNKVELTTTKADGTESFIFEFSTPDARQHFEQSFEEAKKKLASSKNRLDPEFLKAIPIMKTRSGMQFSCASPSISSTDNVHEVWVCNSDGYVGQVCLLSIRNEPTVEACIAVCSARILCIASVPGLKRSYRERSTTLVSQNSEVLPSTLDDSNSQQCLHISISSLELFEHADNASRDLVPFDSDDTDDESSPSPSGTLQSQASRSTISSSFRDEEMPSAKDTTTETTSSEEEQEPGFLPIPSTFSQNRDSESPKEGQAVRKISRGSFTRGSLDDLMSIDPEAYQSSMWLGTEDGCIHVYQSSDNIRNRKNSMKMQHSAAVMCILYLDNQVFVSLANGELIVYQREAGSFWDPQNSKTISLGSPGSPVTKMVSISGKLWCGCQNRVTIFNTTSLIQEHTFHIGQDQNRSVTCMVSSCLGMWIALQSSAQVRLYHATSFEQLAEVDIAPPVHKMLAGSDAIIRQHKSACLRITALLACKDLLWIGTSAGVVLTLPITTSTNSLKVPLIPVGLSQGHTGHVRFLTSVELPDGFDITFPLPEDQGNNQSSDVENRDPTRYRPSPINQSKTKILVISGGDGYEDFRLTSSSETVGRDDSTNHLLLWRV